MVGGGDGQVGPADFASSHPQASESLGRSYFMHQVQVDINDAGFPRLIVHHMSIPDLLEHRFRRHIGPFLKISHRDTEVTEL
ncbi:hypothetical protein MGWOODY_Clf294 [hydrothermal vent metagenome]|uniref:Uncharacterized protein n=1 Tax=hydrothermal vent metagenome TaxID=652676 RepID=A0A160VB05_9ZZZZ